MRCELGMRIAAGWQYPNATLLLSPLRLPALFTAGSYAETRLTNETLWRLLAREQQRPPHFDLRL